MVEKHSTGFNEAGAINAGKPARIAEAAAMTKVLQ